MAACLENTLQQMLLSVAMLSQDILESSGSKNATACCAACFQAPVCRWACVIGINTKPRTCTSFDHSALCLYSVLQQSGCGIHCGIRWKWEGLRKRRKIFSPLPLLLRLNVSFRQATAHTLAIGTSFLPDQSRSAFVPAAKRDARCSSE